MFILMIKNPSFDGCFSDDILAEWKKYFKKIYFKKTDDTETT